MTLPGGHAGDERPARPAPEEVVWERRRRRPAPVVAGVRRAHPAAHQGDHRPVPAVPLGAAAAAAPGAVGGGLRQPGRHPVLRRGAGADHRRGLRGRHLLHDVQAHPVRRAPGQRLHQHAVRGAGRRRHLRAAAGASSASGTRRPRASRAPRARSPWSTPSASPPATSAPVLQVNYEYYDNQTPSRPRQLVDALRRGEKPHPTRGAPLTDLRTVELELAGIFPDLERSVEGPSAATETLRGARLAAERGWTAPAMPDAPPAVPGAPGEEVMTVAHHHARSADPGAHPALAVAALLVASRPTSSSRATRPCGTRSTAHPDQLIQLVKDSGLRGRGGAGFPTGMKWSFIPQGPTGPGAKPKYLVINADEGEPGTCKDIPTMMADPHSLIEGCIITCYAIRANFCAIYVRGEALHCIRRRAPRGRGGLRRRATSARTSSAPGFDLDIVVHAGAGAYICGEETALLDSLEGRRGQPRLKPPFPATVGALRLADRGEQRRDHRVGSRDRAGRQRLVPHHGLGEEPRPEDLLGVRARRAARPVRGPAGHHAAPAAGAGRRHEGRHPAQVLDARAARPPRCSPPSTSTSRWTSRAPPRPARCWAPPPCRSSTRPSRCRGR